MTLTVTPSGAACGATITGIDLTQPLSDDLVAEIRSHWLEHKVVAFPNQPLAPEDLERFAQYFGEIGEDPFFGHIEGYPNICASQRNADEKTTIFADLPYRLELYGRAACRNSAVWDHYPTRRG